MQNKRLHPALQIHDHCHMMIVFILHALILSTFACSDAKLYHQKKVPFQADRLAFKGKVCTANPQTSTKILLLLDQSPGQLYEDYDPALDRLKKFSDLIQSALAKTQNEFAIISYAGRAKRIAPLQENSISDLDLYGNTSTQKVTQFTRDPGILLSAISQLSTPSDCASDSKCRDPLDAIRSAKSLIEDDLAQMEAGQRALSRYVILWGVSGMAMPYANEGACCLPQDQACLNQESSPVPSFRCQNQLELQAIQTLRESILSRGVSSFELNIFYMTEAKANLSIPELAFEKNLLQMSFITNGAYRKFSTVGTIDFRQIVDFNHQPTLYPSVLSVVNQSVAPRASGLLSDSDQDGLADQEETDSDPLMADTDGDFVGDLLETRLSKSATKKTDYPLCEDLILTQMMGIDRDLDGINECEERLLGTDPSLSDTDGDGLVDGLEFKRGTDYLHVDSTVDFDQDGIYNIDELRENTDPRSIDQTGRLGLATRYEIKYEGEKTILQPKTMQKLEGIRISSVQNSIAGVHQLKWTPAQNQQKAKISWQKANDPQFRTEIEITGRGTYQMVYGQKAKDIPQIDSNTEMITLEVTPSILPQIEMLDELLIIEEQQNCIEYKVNNLRLVETLPLKGDQNQVGLNEIYLYLSQENASAQQNQPTLFRIAKIPIRYDAPNDRIPNQAQIKIDDGEFISPSLIPQNF
jgi:hypothetical protein